MAKAPRSIDDLRRHLARGLKIISDKADDYRAAREYADGTRAEVLPADTRAARTVIEQTKSTPISFAHIPIDVIADKVELSAITAADPAAKTVLDEWMDANDVDDESSDWIRKACTFGDYYVVSDPTTIADDDDTTEAADIDSVGLSPLSTVAVYDKKTGRTKLYGLHVWDAGTSDEPATGAVLYYDDCSVMLRAAEKEATDPDLFELDYDRATGEEDDAFLPHAGGRPLLAHLAIGGKPYGVPIHKKAFGPQDAITKISANNLVNVDALGLPSRWALVDGGAEIDDDLDDDFGTDGGATPEKPDNRTTATTGSRTAARAGVTEYLRGVKETGTYEPSSADPFLANLDWYVRAMAVACGIPLFEFDLNGEQPSGEARRRAEGRANRIAARVKRNATAFLREIADTVLGLVGTESEVSVTFSPSETATDKEGLELVALKVKAGVPVRQALREAGYTDEQIEEWYPEGAPALTPDLLAVLAEVLAKLGNAVTLQALKPEHVEAMIPSVFEYVKTAAVEGPLPGVQTRPATAALVTNAGSAAA